MRAFVFFFSFNLTDSSLLDVIVISADCSSCVCALSAGREDGEDGGGGVRGGRVGAEAEAVPVRIRGLGRNSTLQSLQILAL